ncbi:GNAT family N-acetyltransferase [Mesorhizobium sp. M0816]|uniref:GNAT family N-acetyltransferase n=1 Tax=Mesorhizobium sp. M0816 TaxID=2957006 RepID=UPI003336BC8D
MSNAESAIASLPWIAMAARSPDITLWRPSIPIASLPDEQTKHLPRYPVLPAILVGRLAVDAGYQRRRVGSALIVDALRRSVSAAPAAFALIVDAKDDQAVAYYRRHGFTSFQSRPASLFLPIATALKLFG